MASDHELTQKRVNMTSKSDAPWVISRQIFFGVKKCLLAAEILKKNGTLTTSLTKLAPPHPLHEVT